MNDPDKPLHDAELSNLYQQSRREEPPMALDSAVLRQARQAVEKPAKRSLWRHIGWRMPLATVAIAMLTVSLVIQMKHEQSELLAPVPKEMLEVSPMEEGALMDADIPEPKMEREKRASSRLKESKKSLGEMAPKAMQVAPPPASGATTGPSLSKPMPITPQGSGGAAPALRSAPAAADRLATGAASEKLESEMESVPSETGIENWLQDIRELIRQGKQAEARDSLKAFRQAYPTYPVPEDIISAIQ